MKLTFKLILLLVFISNGTNAQINRHTRPVENNLERYNPAPAAAQIMALQIEQQRLRAIATSYKEYYGAIESFKQVSNGTYKAIVIIDQTLKLDGYVTVADNKVQKLMLANAYDATNGLRITSNINNAYAKVFLTLEDRMIPVDIYLPDFYFQ